MLRVPMVLRSPFRRSPTPVRHGGPTIVDVRRSDQREAGNAEQASENGQCEDDTAACRPWGKRA